MTHTVGRLLSHHAIRSLLFERLLLTASALLAAAALVSGRVTPREVPGLMDTRLLSLLFVLTIAVELGKASDLFDRLVAAVASRVRDARSLAVGMVAVSGGLAALLTNDVALFLVVPFTMAFRRATDVDLARIVVLEVIAANVLGAISPLGNPQNLFLYTRGGFTAASFFAAQAPWTAVAAGLLVLAVRLRVPKRPLLTPRAEPFDVDARLAGACLVLLSAEILSLFGAIGHALPLLLALAGAVILGRRRLLEIDFSFVVVFALLFVGVAGLERGRVYQLVDPVRVFGHHARGLVLSGALLSQIVSNVPAALLLAPAASGPAGFRGLLYGVNTGGCGTPVSSIANLIGAQLFVREGGSGRAFWRRFLPVSSALLLLLAAASLLLVS
jgi:Na+/H+ antiporter NhaD/arsenite permease-like protein